MHPKQKNFILNALRNLSKKCPKRGEAVKKLRVAAATWECAMCGDWLYSGSKDVEQAKKGLKIPPNVTFRKANYKMDHIEPVIPVTGWVSWDDYIIRLFCEPEGYQALCKECHDKKSAEEAKQRKKHRKET